MCVEKNLELHFLPADARQLLQPCDGIIINEFRKKFAKEVDEWIEQNQNNCADDDEAIIIYGATLSAKVPLPPKSWILQKLDSCKRACNARAFETDKTPTWSQVRKNMILCGLEPDGAEGHHAWKVDQLKDQLKSIINRYPENFDGEKPPRWISPHNEEVGASLEENYIDVEGEDRELVGATTVQRRGKRVLLVPHIERMEAEEAKSNRGEERDEGEGEMAHDVVLQCSYGSNCIALPGTQLHDCGDANCTQTVHYTCGAKWQCASFPNSSTDTKHLCLQHAQSRMGVSRKLKKRYGKS